MTASDLLRRAALVLIRLGNTGATANARLVLDERARQLVAVDTALARLRVHDIPDYRKELSA